MVSSKELIRLCIPQVGEDELEEISEVFASGYLTQGEKTTQFEEMVAAYTGAKYAITTTSATTALHLSLAALNIGPGDEVLVPDFTFPATANVVIQQGARPVLVDIDLNTFNIDIEDMNRKITSRTRAVLPVHLFGLSAEMDPVLHAAKKKKLLVIEDAACALGAQYKGKMCGTMGNAGCFSFHPRKIITTGEGGMVVTNDSRLASRLRALRNHGGIRRSGRYRFLMPGYNYRLSDICSAIGIAQMRKIGFFIEKRREYAALYRKELSSLRNMKLPVSSANGASHIFQSYVVLLDSAKAREKTIQRLAERQIEATLGTYALHTQPYMNRLFGYKSGDIPNSYSVYKRALSLPIFTGITHSEIGRTSKALRIETT